MGFQVVCQTKEITVAQLEPEMLKLIKPYLPSQEQILICLENTMEQFVTGLFGNDRIEYANTIRICTQTRIIDASRWYRRYEGWNESFGERSLNDIESVGENRGDVTYSTLNADPVKEVVFGVSIIDRFNKRGYYGFSSYDLASKFAAIVRNAVAQAKARNQVAASPNSVEERIRALKQLRQDGLITEAQFQQKIQEIVSQL